VHSFLLATAVIVAMLAIVPLMVWGGSGDWRYALTALKEYLQVFGILLLLGGGAGVIVAFAEYGWGVLRMFTGH
jgi:hypothetical protein